jgi:RNase H-like domain found in reverse transcriptase
LKDIKHELTSTRILKLPDKTKAYTLECDASSVAYGAVLLQNWGEMLKPVGFFLGKFTDAEKNYSVLEPERLAVILSLKNWAYLLEGSPFPVRVRTDHKNLEAIKKIEISSERHVRWQQYLARFSLDVCYSAGEQNSFADIY